MASDSGNTDKSMCLCKKCGETHEKPIDNKCEKTKTLKDEKRDSSKESTKKTPQSKAHESSPNDKVLDFAMSTMRSFTEKLSAKEEKISGLSYRMDVTPTALQTASTRKSRSRDKGRRIETSDVGDERHPLISPTRSLVTDNARYYILTGIS